MFRWLILLVFVGLAYADQDPSSWTSAPPQAIESASAGPEPEEEEIEEEEDLDEIIQMPEDEEPTAAQ